MDDNAAKSSSCLAIVEKKPHRPGGCVGIFFQLFDWNRRLAKKKLFSKKLLPPARAKQASRKFGGDEKLPMAKLLLIADENSGGFPNLKKNGIRTVDSEQNYEMRQPSLVARLMGLEFIPSVKQDKLKKASFSEPKRTKEEKTERIHVSSDKEDVILEKSQTKNESRPQKLQKTGLFDGRAVTRFGPEALHIKSVLSRSRKHHSRLASSVKSPRILSAKNASSRLIDAATKILEPSLHANNKTKCALTYGDSTHTLAKGAFSSDLLDQSSHFENASKSLKTQTSCTNCGNLLVDDSLQDEQSSFLASTVSAFVSESTEISVRTEPMPILSPVDKERDVVSQSHRNCTESIVNSKAQHDIPSSITSKNRTQLQTELLLRGNGVQPRSKISNMQNRKVSSSIVKTLNGPSDFVSPNRNPTGRAQPKMQTKLDNCKFDMGRESSKRRDDSLSQIRNPVRKRRPVDVNRKIENTGFEMRTYGNQRNVQSRISGKRMGVNTRSKSRMGQESLTRAHSSKESDVVSFTFSSPLRHKTKALSRDIDMMRRDQQHEVSCNSTSHKTKLVLDNEVQKNSILKPLPLKRDALGALLEEKLKELSRQEEDELTVGTTPPGRSTASILQDLISALTSESLTSQRQISGHDANTTLQVEDHLSPGSVLEVSFSNDSCFSSSLDDSIGPKLHPDFTDCFYYSQPQIMESDVDLLDSATSSNKGLTISEMVKNLPNHISMMLLNSNLTDIGLTGHKLSHAKEIILNTELLFQNASLDNFLIGPFLLDQLEILVSTLWKTSNCFLGFEEKTKEGNQLRIFLFDCLIECLERKYGRYCKTGLKAWSRIPVGAYREVLISEVDEEVRKWVEMAGKIQDEIIEWEMSHSLGKWTDFEIEAYESGAEIDGGILYNLVDEIVADLLDNVVGSS